MKTCLVELKLKDTESIDWKKGLVSYLKRSYGSGQWSQFYDEKLANEMDHLRNNANGDLAIESLLEQNCVYYAFLEQLHLRLGNGSGQLRIDFTWYDAEYNASQKSQKCSQHNLILEKSCVLYNIAVCLTQLAREKMSEDLKVSVGLLSKATSCFEYLSENFLNSPSVDLQAENTKFLADLSHAEAQELFLLKLINGGDPVKQASLISKLAYAIVNQNEKCSEFYDETEETTARYGELKWRSIIKCKIRFYKAITAYHYALALEQQSKYGEAIAFLTLAHDSLISSLVYKTYLKDVIDFQAMKENIEEKKRKLTKDNDFIYHDSIPQSVDLAVIKSMDAIKPLGWSKQIDNYMDQVSDKCNVLFKGIVPMEIYEKESIYSEEKASLLRKEMEDNETANWEYSSFVEFTNLPKLLRDMEQRYKDGSLSASDNPQLDMMREQLKSWAKTVQTSPYKNFELQMKLIASKRQEIIDILPNLSEDQKDNVVKVKSALVEASQSDQRLFSLVRPFIKQINLLKDDTLLWNEFDSFILNRADEPSLLDLDDTKTSKIVEKLKLIRQLSEDLKLLKDERSRNLRELKAELNNDDITRVLLSHHKKLDSELKEVFAQEMAKFKPFSTRIEAAIYKQTSTINEIKMNLDEVFKLSGFQNKSKDELESLEACKNWVHEIEEAVENFSIFASDLPKGLAFYESLLNMSKDLAVATKKAATAQSNPPPLPTPLSSMERQLQGLSVSQNHSLPPSVPPRTYLESAPTYGGYSRNIPPLSNSSIPAVSSSPLPPVPPKPPRSSLNSSKARDIEEQEIQSNPTSFYDRPSVFDENLYSKFSG